MSQFRKAYLNDEEFGANGEYVHWKAESYGKVVVPASENQYGLIIRELVVIPHSPDQRYAVFLGTVPIVLYPMSASALQMPLFVPSGVAVRGVCSSHLSVAIGYDRL